MTTPHQQQPAIPPQAPAQAAPPPHPQWGGGAPGGAYPSYPSYVSPIPVRGTHLGHAIASEWTKIKSVRSTVWTLGIFLVLVVGIGLVIALLTDDEDYIAAPVTFPAFFGLILGQVCMITLGVLVVSSEYGTGLIRATMTASPKRWRVLTAKLLVFFALVFVTSTLSILLVGLVSSGLHSTTGVAATNGAHWTGAVLGAGLYVSLLGVLSLAVGSMLRHSAGAITAMLGVVLLPAVAGGFLLISSATRTVGEKMLEYNSTASIALLFQMEGEGATQNGLPQLGLLAGVTAAAIAGAFVLLEKRDV
ncbi:ABC transporter permease subunit [Streptomyces sp. GC420]|uniref:ABC transporter permease subunit n=1 Tax=Streptomyces sp. GC420 TaxID=2697568 RepID=UPI0014150D29|nr:ABC transporter permease subunit [Streptomyces sp. GC420]NBM14879.1 ABC transporter permease subunit [Streptomyces sp. GC420]